MAQLFCNSFLPLLEHEVALWFYFDQQNVAGSETVQVLEPRFQNAFQLPASPLWNIPATMKGNQARLTKGERPHG